MIKSVLLAGLTGLVCLAAIPAEARVTADFYIGDGGGYYGGGPGYYHHHHRGYYPGYAYDPYYPGYYGPPPPPVVYAPPAYYQQPVYAQPTYVQPAPQPEYAGPPGVDPASSPYTDDQGRTCREYQSHATVAGSPQHTYGTACLQPDGSWRIVN